MRARVTLTAEARRLILHREQNADVVDDETRRFVLDSESRSFDAVYSFGNAVLDLSEFLIDSETGDPLTGSDDRYLEES